MSTTTLRFGRYELFEVLGRGGMGEVYRAFDTEQRRLVALKMLPETLAGDPVLAERFRREAYAAAQLRGPHVLPVHSFGEIEGRLYIDMRLVDGRDLATVLAADGPLPPARAVRIIEQVAEALDEAHAARLVHRDVKPSNVMVTGRDFVYLFDFGIAHVVGASTGGASLTSTGTTIGTLAYMAPERFVAPDRIDGRADVYSLACLLFEVLTGRPPFTAADLPGLLHAHLSSPPPAASALRPSVPAAVDAVVARGMAKDPGHRQATAGALAVDAARALQAGPASVPAPRISAPYPAVPPPRSPSGPVASGQVPFRPVPFRPEHGPFPPPPNPYPAHFAPPPPRPPRRQTGWLGAAVAVLVVLIGVAALLSAGGGVRATPTGGSASTPTRSAPSGSTPSRSGVAGQESGIPASYAGTWAGRVNQVGQRNTTYGVVIEIVAGTQRTTVRYPDLNCSGTQELESVSASGLTLTERITVGRTSCVDGVPIVLTLAADGQRMSYSFSHLSEEGRGVLTRA